MDELKLYEKCLPLPERKANIVSRLFFSWTIPILIKGYRKNLDTDDLFEVRDEDLAKYLGDELERLWNHELQACKMGNKPPSLGRCLWRMFRVEFCLNGLTVFFEEVIFKTLQTICLGLLIMYFNGHKNITREYGFMLAAGLVVCSGTVNLLHHQYFFLNTRTGMRLRTACCSLVYRKSLRLSRAAIGESSVGHMVNLLSNDVNRFEQSPLFFHYLWVGPIQTVVTSVILWYIIGPSCLVGLGVLLLFVPIQGKLGRIFSKMRSRTAFKTDERVRIMNELISAIRVIKMYAWELPFIDLISKARGEEINVVRKAAICKAINTGTFYSSAKLTLFLTLLAYVMSGKIVSAEIVFSILSLFNNFKLTVTLFIPLAVASLAETRISVGRLQTFLTKEELKQTGRITRKHNAKKEESVLKIDNLTACWKPNHQQNTLSNVSINGKEGELIAIIGHIGSGKSSLLYSLLGELPVLSGNIDIKGSLSYASQEAWIFNASVKQNILFGSDLDRKRYMKVIRAAALERDFELLPFGDETIVGDKGISLSGGQKARINLARAIYRDADIYLLDDPLSAVDTHVGKHLFEHCIRGYLASKMIFLVTHQLQYLKKADKIVLLNQGKVSQIGTYDELIKAGVDLSAYEEEKLSEADELLKEEEELKEMKLYYERIKRGSKNDPSLISELSSSTSLEVVNEDVQKTSKLREVAFRGTVSATVYWSYIRAGSSWPVLFLMVLINIVCQVLYAGSDVWLSYWTAYEGGAIQRLPIKLDSDLFLYIYAGIIGGLVVAAMARTTMFQMSCMKSSFKLHNRMFETIIRAPIAFFDNNSSGVVLNRFSKDLGIMDEIMPQTFDDTYTIFLTCLGSVIVVIITNYWIVIPTAFLVILFILVRSFYLGTSRDVKRLEGMCRSPVVAQLSSTLSGMTTIRAFQSEEQCIEEFDGHQNLHSSSWYLYQCTSRWLGITVDWIITIYIAAIVFSFMAHSRDSMGSKIGLAISTALSLSGAFQWGIRQSAELENQMTSVERILEYGNLEPEPDWESPPDKKPPKEWPSQGKIEFKDVSLKYTDNYVLKNLTFLVHPREKVGIVGRTGAGKSSLISTLFRMTETEGQILIDDVDIGQIGLHDLRSTISIIPQDPVLFTGSLRKNLDPFSDYSEDALWSALEEVELKEAVMQLPHGMEHMMTEGGSNFSVGQRQLVCLARAILRKHRVLVMDEATANVDLRTDQLIQATIREKFKSCTILTIAHRLDTIMDGDRVIVMDAGRIVEFDSPYLLLQNPEGIFSSMVDQTGISTSRTLRSVAEKAYKLRHGTLEPDVVTPM